MTAQTLEETRKKFEEALKKSLEEAGKSQFAFDEQFKKAKETSVYSQALVNAMNTANDAAYDIYKKTSDLNKAKADLAFDEYRKTSDELSRQYRDGSISRDEYEQRHTDAYQKACDLKKGYDEESDKAYDQYLKTYETNGKKIGTVNETQKEQSINLSVPQETKKTNGVQVPETPSDKNDSKVSEEQQPEQQQSIQPH